MILMKSFKTFITEKKTNWPWAEHESFQHQGETFKHFGDKDGHDFTHEATVHGRKVVTTFTGGRDFGYKPKHYEVAFSVDDSINQNPNKRTPTHVAAKVLKTVGEATRKFSSLKNPNTGEPHVKGLSWKASDNEAGPLFKKRELYRKLAKRAGAGEPKESGFLGHTIKLKEMALLNKITKDQSVPEVKGSQQYWPDHYKSDAKHVSNLGDLEVHKSENKEGQGTYFTWHPGTRKLHHVLTYTRKGENLENITANGRPGSKVKYIDLLHHLATEHGEKPVTSSSSKGASKSWERLRTTPGVQVQKLDHQTGGWKKAEGDIYDKDHKSPVGKTPIRLVKEEWSKHVVKRPDYNVTTHIHTSTVNGKQVQVKFGNLEGQPHHSVSFDVEGSMDTPDGPNTMKRTSDARQIMHHVKGVVGKYVEREKPKELSFMASGRRKGQTSGDRSVEAKDKVYTGMARRAGLKVEKKPGLLKGVRSIKLREAIQKLVEQIRKQC